MQRGLRNQLFRQVVPIILCLKPNDLLSFFLTIQQCSPLLQFQSLGGIIAYFFGEIYCFPLFFFSIGKENRKFRPKARLTAHLDIGLVNQNRVLDDGKAQPRTAGGLGAALVHAIEPLKNPILAVLRNADAVVLNL